MVGLLVRGLRNLAAITLLRLLLPAASHGQVSQEFLRSAAEPGRYGGRLVIAQSAEPKTLNPVVVLDQPSRNVIRRMMADLIHINRLSQETEPALAKSWTASADGTRFTLKLRQGVRFSDGAPFTADDVVFTFKVYLDEKVQSPQRVLLLVNDQPIKVEKLGTYLVRFVFPAPYSAAERFFDSIVILPRHLLEKDYEDGKIAQSWGLNTPPGKIAGLGPFRLRQFVPGERLVLERNPYYWKIDARGQALPYLDELTFLAVPTQDAQVVRFQAGDTQIISNLSADNYAALSKDQQARHYQLFDAGPGLEYNFLVFNLNSDTEGRLPEIARKQKWFNDALFRQAVSAAIDRDSIVRLVYHGRGVALATHVTPGNKRWVNTAVPVPARSVSHARQLLREAGFNWKADGTLVDKAGSPVEFGILVSSSNNLRSQMATLIQDDLKELGMRVSVTPMEFRASLTRILETHDFETAILGLATGDADPNPDMPLLMSDGQTHFWHMGEKTPATPWEAEIDRLMQKQLVTMNYTQRKKLYDRVQQVLAEKLPVICLASPHVLAGAKEGLGNFHLAILDHYTLWNADELFWRSSAESANGTRH